MARTQKLSAIETRIEVTDDNGSAHELVISIADDGSVRAFVNGKMFPGKRHPNPLYGAFSSANSLLDKLCYMEKIMAEDT